MGRPRRVFSRTPKVVTFLASETLEKLDEVCKKEHVSRIRLLRSLIEGYLSEPVYKLVYRDHVAFENVKDPADYPPAVRKCIGWQVSENREAIQIVSDMAVKKLPGEKEPAGKNGYTILKSDIIELRRLTSV